MVEISVIIPCYNVEDYLEECLDSVINQTFTDTEIICINDGSTDNTLKILEDYSKIDNRIKIINQSNHGLAISRNRGLDVATGKYICFIDSDDYFHLNAFKELYDIAEEKSLDFVFFKLINFDDETRLASTWSYFEMDYLKERVGDNIFSYDDAAEFLFRMNATAPGKLFKHEFIRGLKFPEGLIWEDNPFFIQAMIKAKRMYFYDKYLYFRRMRSTSIVHSYSSQYADCLIIFNMMAEITKDNDCYEMYKKTIFRRKLDRAFKWFIVTNPEDKWDFFNKIKEDFLKYQNEIESDEFFYEINEKYRVIFKAGIYCETPDEFEYTVKNYELSAKNSKLMKDIKKYKDFNESVLNSTAWKITKPLREISNRFK